jgi:uroporphyrinogen decarboxylase
MRQAGRYLPEYRKVREQVDFLTLTKSPELAAEVTLQPIRRFGMDAAILFSDIMTPLEGMGIDLDFDPGPVIRNPVRTAADVDALRVGDPEESVPFVMETIRSCPSRHPSSGLPARRSLLTATRWRGMARRRSRRPRRSFSPSR